MTLVNPLCVNIDRLIQRFHPHLEIDVANAAGQISDCAPAVDFDFDRFLVRAKRAVKRSVQFWLDFRSDLGTRLFASPHP